MSASKIHSMLKILHPRIMEQQMDIDTDEDRNTYSSPPYLLGTHPKTPGGWLELRIRSNPIYTTFFPTHTYL